MNNPLWKFFFRISGWKSEITVENFDKCVICVAPHTSNYDFIIGLLAYRALGRKANFLMKKFWFFFPLGIFLKALGGIPVDRNKNRSLTSKIISLFKSSSYLNLAITPEGTRKPTAEWHTGFLHIAYESRIPVLLGIINYKVKKVIIKDFFQPSGNYKQDMQKVKNYYKDYTAAARYPEKFKL